MWLCVAAAAAAKLLQSSQTLCDPIDGSPPGSTFPGILQARTLEWVAISFSKGMKNRAILPDLRKRYDPVGKRGKPHSQNLETIFPIVSARDVVQNALLFKLKENRDQSGMKPPGKSRKDSPSDGVS